MAVNKGFAGAIIHVDLTTGASETQGLEEELARSFAGGFGINHKLALDYLKPGVDAYSPDNLMIIGAGTLGGTIAPSSSKVLVTTKLPTPKAVGTVVGGTFGDALKYSGFDHVVVRGKSPKPAYLLLEDGRATVMDATDLWGKDIHETTDALKRRHGTEASVIAIGRAGENLVRFAFALVNKIGTLGRGGLGAVMGSKNLKAVVARGTRPIDVADRRRYLRASNAILDDLRSLPYRSEWLQVGSSIAKLRARKGESPDDPYSYGGYLKDFWKAPLACPSCPVSCKFAIQLKNGRYAGEIVHMSMPLNGERFFGKAFNVPNMEQAIDNGIYCDKEGLDGKSASCLVEVAVSLFEEGQITEEATHGLPLKRNFETVKTLLEQITKREGIGDLLAEGWEAVADRYGEEAVNKRIPLVKGIEATYEPRELFNGMAFSQLVNPRGTYGVAGNNPTYLPNRTGDELRRYLQRLHIPEDTIDRIVLGPQSFNLARLTKHTEDWFSVQSCLGVCVRQPVMQCYNVERSAELYSAATGFETSPEEMLKLGEKAWTALKLVNAREGFTRKDDGFPELFYQPLERDGVKKPLGDYYGNPIGREEVEKLLDDYYEERGWDVQTGIPLDSRLEELGLK